MSLLRESIYSTNHLSPAEIDQDCTYPRDSLSWKASDTRIRSGTILTRLGDTTTGPTGSPSIEPCPS